MNRIGFRYSGLTEEEAPPVPPPMQQVVVDGKNDKSGLLVETERRLMALKLFIVSKPFQRLSIESKATKVKELEWLTLVTASLV